jgi:hypothetical protein
MSTAPHLTLFASLRRDRFLFALLGTLVLLLHALQPLAAAQMPGGHMAICTALNADGDAGAAGTSSPGALDDCPVCLIGNACGAAAVYKAALAASPAFPAPTALAGQTPLPLAADDPGALLVAPPPAIRAPPPSA